MPHFLIKSENISENTIKIDDFETVNHLAGALRAKTGEILKFIDENKMSYRAKITEISKKAVTAEIISSEISKRELDFKLYIAQSVLKTDAQTLLISNAAQLGIKGVYPFLSDFSTVKADFVKGKAAKWQKTADEAFKQCERADLMKVFEIADFKEILKKFKKENIVIFAEKDENTDILAAAEGMDLSGEILAVIGPEGGFSDDEFEFFKREGFKMATLGNLIFKAPNAVTAGVSNLIFALELHKKGRVK